MNDSGESSPTRRRSSLIQFLNPLHEDTSEEHGTQQNYGSVGSLNVDGAEEMHAPLNGTTEDRPSDDDDATDDFSYEDEVEARLSEMSSNSFHLGASTRMSVNNILVRERRTSSFLAYGEEYELVPTKLKNNVRMVEDVNLLHGGRGRLYFALYSFFNNGHDTKYAMTVHSDIYTRILDEVNEAHTVPCGLYFCCHGGDGAHTGVSHNDFVDIRLAWTIVAFIFAILLTIEFTVPWPEDDGVIGDDIFSAAAP